MQNFMNVKIEDSWKKALGEEFEKDYFRTLVDFVKREYASSQVFPPGNEILQRLTPPRSTE